MARSDSTDEQAAERAFETDCAHFGEDAIVQGGGATPPIHQSSTFIYPNAEAFERRRTGDTPYPDYTRAGNPTTAILEGFKNSSNCAVSSAVKFVAKVRPPSFWRSGFMVLGKPLTVAGGP